MRALAIVGCAVILALAPGSNVTAQTPGRSSVTLVRPLRIARVSPLVAPALASGGVARLTERGCEVRGVQCAGGPAVFAVSGDPGRTYVMDVRGPASTREGLVVQEVRLWSRNTGEVTGARMAQLDSRGRDVVRVGLELTNRGLGPAPAHVLPLSVVIAYE